jgi:hypothetical protein
MSDQRSCSLLRKSVVTICKPTLPTFIFAIVPEAVYA